MFFLYYFSFSRRLFISLDELGYARQLIQRELLDALPLVDATATRGGCTSRRGHRALSQGAVVILSETVVFLGTAVEFRERSNAS